MRILSIANPVPASPSTAQGLSLPVAPQAITHANQVWEMDITYVRMHKGWLYLCAVVDWYSRKVLAWRLSNTMDVEFCMEAVQEAMTRWGTPAAIFNTDQGSQFTSDAFTQQLKRHGIRISMDGKGA
jgi:putative transposase